MKKTILTLAISCTLLSACAYKPLIDTSGRSGTFNSDTYTDAINSILTVIGSSNISGIHASTHTLSQTIKQLHDELGNVTAVLAIS